MEYWHNLITEQSFKALKKLKAKYDFILIGGWAVFLYSQALKSKDIDVVVSHETLAKLKEKFEVSKNQRLKKYEIKQGEFDIDIYLPYFSSPGLPAEELQKLAVSKEGFKTVPPEILLILKQVVFKVRKNTPKGNKDKIDIFSLINLPGFDWTIYQKALKNYGLTDLAKELKELLNETFEIKELGLSRHKIAQLKKKILAKI